MTRIIKSWLKGLLYRPRGLSAGRGTEVRLPRTISNPQHVQIGARSRIGKRVVLNPIRRYEGMLHHGRIVIGDDVYIGHDCQFHAMQEMHIGHGCVLSDRVYVNDAAHGLDPRAGFIMQQAIHSKGPIRLGEHVFVGYGAVILPGVELGDRCVVAAQSVVTRSQAPGTMVAGNPARPIKQLDLVSGQWRAVQSAEERSAGCE